jgi:hypothetical protein
MEICKIGEHDWQPAKWREHAGTYEFIAWECTKCGAYKGMESEESVQRSYAARTQD